MHDWDQWGSHENASATRCPHDPCIKPINTSVNLGTWTGPDTRKITVGAFDLLSALRDEIVEHALRHMHDRHLFPCLWSRVSLFSPPVMDSKLSKPDAKKSNLGSRRIPGAYPRGLPSTTCRWARKVELPLTATLSKPTLAKASQGICLFVCDYTGMCVHETSVGPGPPIHPPLPSFHANAYKIFGAKDLQTFWRPPAADSLTHKIIR